MADYYDRIAPVYDRRWQRYSDMTHQMVQNALPEVFTDVLDFGCGTGRLLELIGQNRPVRLHGVDASAAMLAVAQRRLGTGAQLYQGTDMTAVPAASFDLIICANTAHYFEPADALQLLTAMRARLRPLGSMVVVDFDSQSRAVRYGMPLLTRVDAGLRQVYDQAAFEKLLQAAGFTVDIRQQQPLGFWWHGWLLRAQPV